MNANPYAPPAARVADIENAEAAQPAPFFAVSVFKLTVMSLCTMGLYEVYWFYRNWKLIRERDGSPIMPFWRAFFGVFFCYACFAKIREFGESRNVSGSLAAGPLTTGWIVCTLTWRLPDPYGLISLLAFVFVLPVQSYVNRLNGLEAPQHERNARFNAWNWLGIVLGGAVLVLALIGTFLPEVE